MKLADSELGYLYGFYCGDGYAYHDKKSRHRYVEFFVDSKDTDLIVTLSKILIKVGFTPFSHKDSRFNCIRIRVNSKEFYEKIQELEKNFPASQHFGQGFVEGLIDADGYTNKIKGFIEIVNTDRELLERSISVLSSLGLDTVIRNRPVSSKDRKRSYRVYVPMKFTRFNIPSLRIHRASAR